MTSIVFYDTEFTTWPGALESNWGEPWQHRELVQIGAIRFDLETLEEIDELDILIKPKLNPALSPYFVNLTGITQDAVDNKGLSFPEAYRLFTAYIGDLEASSYGPDDIVVRENLALHAMPAAETDFSGFDIGPWFKKEGGSYGVGPKTNSGKLAATLGAPMKALQEHNALHDVRSICAAYRFLRNKGVKSPL